MEELQLRIWGYTERDVVPSQMFVVAVKSGGQVLGAFVDDQFIGFALAFAGVREGRVYLHSHKAAVLPEYRDRGVGRELKLAQRADALERGIDRIEWTFDPLQGKNAYFNICRLGVIVRHYLRDVYGATSSPLHAGLPTDRLVAEWLLNSPRVIEILAGEMPIVGAEAERVPVLVSDATDGAGLARVQTQARERFEALFSQDYAVTWFERENGGGTYVLERLRS